MEKQPLNQKQLEESAWQLTDQHILERKENARRQMLNAAEQTRQQCERKARRVRASFTRWALPVAAALVLAAGGAAYALYIPVQHLALSQLPQPGINRADDGITGAVPQELHWQANAAPDGFQQVRYALFPSGTGGDGQSLWLLKALYQKEERQCVFTASQSPLAIVDALTQGNGKQLGGVIFFFNRDPETGEWTAAWRQNNTDYLLQSSQLACRELCRVAEALSHAAE